MKVRVLLSALLSALAFIAAAPAIAQDATGDVVIRTTLRPENDVVVGQHVRVFVDVLFAGEMPRPPHVTLAEPAGAQILRYESQATTMNDVIEGKPYIGQRFEFAFYARRGGTLEIPAPSVTVFDGQGNETGRMRGKSAGVRVAVPPGVDPSKPVVATERFTLDQQWSAPPATGFKAGDALVRTITRTAADVPGMAMLDLGFAAPPGVRVYVDTPDTADRLERGDVTGRRTDRATYVFEAGGTFSIPDVVQPWWDLSSGRLRRAEGRGTDIAVAAAVAPGGASASNVERWLFYAATTAGLVSLAWWLWPRVRRHREARRTTWVASEPKAFRDLEEACRRDDARTVYRAFVAWRRRTSRPASLTALAEDIEATLFAGAPWSRVRADDFARHAQDARRDMLAAAPASSALPPLNPGRLPPLRHTAGE